MLKVIVPAILIFCSCISSNTSKNNSSENIYREQPDTVEETKIVDELKNPDVIIEFERTRGECSESCPIYKIIIFSDGSVVFDGKQNVRQFGLVKSKLSRLNLEKIVFDFREAGFFDLGDKYFEKDSCPEFWTHASTVRIYFHNGESSKNVYHYQGCKGTKELKNLADLEEKIEKIVNSQQWIGS